MGFGGAKNAWKACADTLRTLEQFMLLWLMRTMFNRTRTDQAFLAKFLTSGLLNNISQIGSFPQCRDENKKCLKPPPRWFEAKFQISALKKHDGGEPPCLAAYCA